MRATCPVPPGMIPIMELDKPMFDHIMRHATDLTLAYGEPLTILGLCYAGAVCCQNSCQFSHNHSVVVIPDVALIELISNGFSEEPTLQMRRADGRSAHAYRITLSP